MSILSRSLKHLPGSAFFLGSGRSAAPLTARSLIIIVIDMYFVRLARTHVYDFLLTVWLLGKIPCHTDHMIFMTSGEIVVVGRPYIWVSQTL